MGLFDNFNFKKLKEGLQKTQNKIVNTINEVITGKAVIDDKTLDEIEDILVSSDIGFDASAKIIDNTKKRLKDDKDRSGSNVLQTVKEELISILEANKKGGFDEAIQNNKPYIILIVGINGVGKTTTIGKLANNYKKSGLSVIVAAADTFRAAANEQLEIWSKRANVEIVQKSQGSDPSSVVYEAIQKAIKDKTDIVLIDTAGRLHNKVNLMDELNKIKRVINKLIPTAPNETLLILDGNTGQNAIIQAEEFAKVTDISGLVITKLDGTAKGGVVFQIVAKQSIPIRFIGVGEGIDDLQTFDSKLFVDAIFE